MNTTTAMESHDKKTNKGKAKLIMNTFVCEICTDTKPMPSSFKIKDCSHFYCSNCILNYISSKLEDGATWIRCPVPRCSGTLDPEHCRDILPLEVRLRWGTRLFEAVIPASKKFYCPFNDCSTLMVKDGGEAVTRAECPNCKRMFCAMCRVTWHEGVECEEYKRLNKDEREDGDLLLRKLAKAQGWDRCPECGFYVEKIDGCNYICCRNCSTGFSYGEGALYNTEGPPGINNFLDVQRYLNTNPDHLYNTNTLTPHDIPTTSTVSTTFPQQLPFFYPYSYEAHGYPQQYNTYTGSTTFMSMPAGISDIPTATTAFPQQLPSFYPYSYGAHSYAQQYNTYTGSATSFIPIPAGISDIPTATTAFPHQLPVFHHAIPYLFVQF